MEPKQPNFFQKIFNRKPVPANPEPEKVPSAGRQAEVKNVDIAPNDPLLAYLLSHPGVVQVEKLKMDSPTLDRLREEGVKVVVPLVSQGELIGLLNLGPRMSEQEYSSDDFRLLNTLATQASPALRVAQLARQQLIEAQQRERIDQELRVARVIQETLLPRVIPQPEGWEIAAFWQPAREVSGDFYDFIYLEDGRLGIIIADVTDKGVPAAMVMATTRSLLRAAAERLVEPGAVLARANDLLHPDIPQKMFVTCLYIVLNPITGHILFANAGHNLPYLRTATGIVELRVTGMPLGLMPGMPYEQKEAILKPGERLLMLSDGLIEAHNGQREMFGFPRLKELLVEQGSGAVLIDTIMQALHGFTGPDYEQEDDITLVTIERRAVPPAVAQELAEFSIPSQPGNERMAAAQVLDALAGVDISAAQQKKLETAVAEATMNAMEHGNKYQVDLPVLIRLSLENGAVVVKIEDQGGGESIPASTEPDLDAKLAGLQSPRGWGLFLIKNMVDEMETITTEQHHTLVLKMHLEGAEHA